MNNYLQELNDVQREAVINSSGPTLIIAGAGSGKTRVLTYRVAHLLSSGVRAGSILALTFTNKAAREMKERIIHLAGPEISRNLWMGTFHSIFARILRYEASVLGYSPNFTIYDTVDSKSVINSIIREMKLDDKVYKASEVLGRISHAKNNLITVAAYSNDPQIQEGDKWSRKPHIADIYKTYATRCYKSDAMDFDDLLLNTNILFRDFPAILARYQERFGYILVDEYQDTNYSQYLIIKKLSALTQNICVVGDDAQSIYSFRGARIENILNFKNDYPGYKLFKLEQNYRSTQNIVNAANSLIAKNKRQISKQVWSDNEMGEKVKVLRTITDNDEGYVVVNHIIDTRYNHRFEYNEYAILYRTNAQSRIFEEALRRKNIPYKIYGGISFYQRKEIKDMIAYFRLIVNKKDDEALKRVINYPARGIGNTTIEKLESFSNTSGVNTWELITNPGKYPLDINKGTQAKLVAFAEMIEKFSAGLHTMDAYDLAFQVASETCILKELYNDKSPETVSKYENIQELLNGIKEFSSSNESDEKMITLDIFIENVSLLTDADTEKKEDRNKVSLMTIHSAKGLEFSMVYIVGVEEELFPNKMSTSTIQELEEERRLFYVAITRAKKQAVVSYAGTRYRWGNLTGCTPSRFIREIGSEFVELPDEKPGETGDEIFEKEFTKYERFKPKHKPEAPAVPKFVLKNKLKKVTETYSAPVAQSNTGTLNYQVGMLVEHERFGIGKIVLIEGSEPNVKASIVFQNSGQKQLLLKFARLKIIE